MWKQLVLTAALISVFVLPGAVTAQDGTFRIWQTLDSQDTDAIATLVDALAADSASEPELVYIDGPFLLDSMLQAVDSRTTPDVIFSNNSNADPLLQSGLLATDTLSREFFLEDLLGSFPDLASELCGKTALEDCLWPDAAEVFPMITPQARAMSLATSVLCDSSPWLPLCDSSALTMAPLGWNFDLYLINSEWMAENGIKRPASADAVLDLRSDYAIRFATAREGAIPTVDEAGYPSVFVLSSSLLREDADAVMESLASFYAEDYFAVVGLNVYGVYISAGAVNITTARDFALAMMNDTDAKIFLMDSSGHVPALTTAELVALGSDDPIVTYTMQTLALLTTYAASY